MTEPTQSKRAPSPILGPGLACFLCWACGPAVFVENPSPFDVDDPSAQRSESEETVVRTPVALDRCPRTSTDERKRRFVVSRSALLTVLDGGPGPILSALEVKPRFREQSFIGWEIMQFMPCETRFDGIDMRPGDLVGLVNRQPLARPGQLALLWAELRDATAIVIDMNREGEAFELRFDVREDANSTVP